MPSPCCVPACRGNYKNGPKVSVYSFPTDQDLKQRWIRAIKRDHFVPTKYSRVCERHFTEKDFQYTREAYDDKCGKIIQAPLNFKRLAPGAIPSILPDLPVYFSTPSTTRDDPETKAKRKEQELIQAAIAQSLDEKATYDAERSCTSIQEIKDKFKIYDSVYWTQISNEKSIMFLHINEKPIPEISSSVIIDVNLNVNVHVHRKEIKNLGTFKFPFVINNTNDVSEILSLLQNIQSEKENNDDIQITLNLIIDLLNSLKDFDKVKKESLKFVTEQIYFLYNNKFSHRYSADTMVFSSLLYSIAPCAYKFIRQSTYLTLPHPNTLNRLFFKYNVSPQIEDLELHFLSYINQKFKHLSKNDLIVILMLDEIHIKEFIEYKGGNICGVSYDAKNCASSAHCFMIKSIVSKYKDVVHILPVSSINGDILHKMIRKIVIGLENIGFKVICVCTDNNSVNRNGMSQFIFPNRFGNIYPHPQNSDRPLFYLIDTVHLLKCIRNNWLNQKNDGKCFYYPEFDQNPNDCSKIKFKTARFNTIKDLFNLESNELVKYGFKLNLKAISPSNMERQNVKLVLCIFNHFVIQALKELGEKHNLIDFEGTSDFLKIILTWWEIVNVKSPHKGKRLKNIYQEPLMYDEGDVKLVFLHKFLDWLDLWKKMKCDTGMLSRETHSALHSTTDGIIQLANYSKQELNLQYILPGQFQTDDLESRFGNYRRLAGCQYNISTQQLIECEKKLRIQSLLHLNIDSKTFGEIKVDSFETGDISLTNKEAVPKVFSGVNITASDIKSVDSQLPPIMYLAGYCIFHSLKNLNCPLCKELHQLDSKIDLPDEFCYLKSLDRGSLCYPRKHIVNVILFVYIIIKKLCSNLEGEFLKVENQRNLIVSLTMNLIHEKEIIMMDEVCGAGHSYEKIIVKVICSATNIFLNNYAKKKNDDIREAVCNKKNLAAKKAEMRKSLKNSNNSKKQCITYSLSDINWNDTNFET